MLYGRDRREPAARVRAALARGLRGLEPGTHRQRRGRAVPARRLRRGRSTPSTWAASSASRRTTRAGASSATSSSTSSTTGASPTRASGRCAAHAATSPTRRCSPGWRMDRAVRAVEKFGLEGPLERWREVRDEIHADVLEKGFDTERNTFTQYYGSKELDASLLMMPLVHFLPATDERMRGTVAAIKRELMRRRLRAALPERPDRRRPAARRGHLPGVHVLAGRQPGADRASSRRRPRSSSACSSLRNDVGLLAEEYDPQARPTGRQLPAGADACRAGHLGVQPRPRPKVARTRPAQRLVGQPTAVSRALYSPW